LPRVIYENVDIVFIEIYRIIFKVILVKESLQIKMALPKGGRNPPKLLLTK
jgi:hypothetical protein